MRRNKGFTIIELLMVVVLISVLMTIVVTAASNSIKAARRNRNEAARVALEAAIATYQAADSNGRWPGALQSVAESGESRVLSDSEGQNVFRILVQKSTGESGAQMVLIDPHLLYVAPTGGGEGKANGLSFDDARQGDAHRRKLPVAQMDFGYQASGSGKFYTFKVLYNAKTDSVQVRACCQRCVGINGCRDGSCRCHE